jgi:hypothetical protein
MREMFKLACRKYGLTGEHAPLSTENFRRPGATKKLF